MQKIHDYQGFSLILQELSQLLDLLQYDKKNMLSQSGFGDNKIRGIRDYLRDFKLLDEQKNISALGKLVVKNDKKLIDNYTKWICLYHWSDMETNPALYYLININLGVRRNSDLIQSFKNWAFSNQIQVDYKKDFVGGLFNKTFTALTNTDAFLSLNLFAVDDGQVCRTEPYNVHPLLLAYVLYSASRGRHSISMAELLTEPGNIGNFFGYDMRTLDSRVSDLDELGIVKRVQVANLNMIELLYNGSPLAFVERYYNEY